MEKLYVPYAGGEPATVDINGHRVVILSHERETLEDEIGIVGGDNVVAVEEEGLNDESEAMRRLAETAHAHVILSPKEVSLAEFVQSLTEALPWVH